MLGACRPTSQHRHWIISIDCSNFCWCCCCCWRRQKSCVSWMYSHPSDFAWCLWCNSQQIYANSSQDQISVNGFCSPWYNHRSWMGMIFKNLLWFLMFWMLHPDRHQSAQLTKHFSLDYVKDDYIWLRPSTLVSAVSSVASRCTSVSSTDKQHV